METIQFIGLSPEDLIIKIKEELTPIIINEIVGKLSSEFQPKQPDEYFTRAEVCRLLSVNQSTLYRWCKAGIIPSYSLGGRVYFKCSEIEEIISNNIEYKK